MTAGRAFLEATRGLSAEEIADLTGEPLGEVRQLLGIAMGEIITAAIEEQTGINRAAVRARYAKERPGQPKPAANPDLQRSLFE